VTLPVLFLWDLPTDNVVDFFVRNRLGSACSSKEDAMQNLEVVLIHGTWAPKATWPSKDGKIAKTIDDTFNGEVAVDDFRWSGKNRHEHRRDAANRLIEKIKSVNEGEPEKQRILVAHSHAGNIASYAALDPAARERIAGIVTLATPFIVGRPRNLGMVGATIAQALAVGLTLLIVYILNKLWIADWPTSQKILTFSAVIITIELPALILVKRWGRFSEELLSGLRHGLPEDSLIIRSVGDEASRGIEFTQLPSMLVSLLIGKMAHWTDGIVARSYQLTRSPVKAVGFMFLTLVASLLPGFLVFWLTESTLAMYLTLIGCMSLTWGPLVFLFLGNVHLACVVAVFPIALLMAPIMFVLGILSLAFGPSFALANFRLDVSAEAIPPGKFSVTLLADQSDPTPGNLQHSVLYNDPQAIELICAFVAERLAGIKRRGHAAPLP
jgi:hypothetical protein